MLGGRRPTLLNPPGFLSEAAPLCTNGPAASTAEAFAIMTHYSSLRKSIYNRNGPVNIDHRCASHVVEYGRPQVGATHLDQVGVPSPVCCVEVGTECDGNQ